MYVTAGGDAAVSARAHGSLVSGVLYTACASWLVKVTSILLIERLSKAANRVDSDDDVKGQLVVQGQVESSGSGSGSSGLELGYSKVRVEESGEEGGNDLESGVDNGEGYGDIETRKPSYAWGGN